MFVSHGHNGEARGVKSRFSEVLVFLLGTHGKYAWPIWTFVFIFASPSLEDLLPQSHGEILGEQFTNPYLGAEAAPLV